MDLRLSKMGVKYKWKAGTKMDAYNISSLLIPTPFLFDNNFIDRTINFIFAVKYKWKAGTKMEYAYVICPKCWDKLIFSTFPFIIIPSGSP